MGCRVWPGALGLYIPSCFLLLPGPTLSLELGPNNPSQEVVPALASRAHPPVYPALPNITGIGVGGWVSGFHILANTCGLQLLTFLLFSKLISLPCKANSQRPSESGPLPATTLQLLSGCTTHSTHQGAGGCTYPWPWVLGGGGQSLKELLAQL